MAKQQVRDIRFDFRGGLSTRKSPELLEPNELVTTQNVRVTDKQGALSWRLGTRRMHQTGLGASISGLYQWDNAGTKQLVAIANGDLHYKSTDYGAFSSSSPTPAMASAAADFTTHRQSTAGAPLRLYIADGTYYWRWTGSALTRLDGTNSLTDNVTHVKNYHVRNFMVSSDLPQHLFWTVIGDPEDGTVGAGDQGGSAMVNVMSGEGITALEVVGSSLFIGTPDSIVRFTGYSTGDIKIEQDTEGISANYGPVGTNAMLRVEEFAAVLADIGPYALTESQSVFLGEKVKPEFDALDRTVYSASVIGYHKGRREIWFAVPGASDSSTNKTVYVYNLDLGAWMGPFTYPFAITCFASWEDSNGDETIVAGCSDGFVRHMDIGYLDDVLYDASGGSSYSATAELAPSYFPDVGPGVVKTLRRITMTGNINYEQLTVELKVDDGDWLPVGEPLGLGNKVVPYRVDAYGQGDRFSLRVTGSATSAVDIHGISMVGYNMARPAEQGY